MMLARVMVNGRTIKDTTMKSRKKGVAFNVVTLGREQGGPGSRPSCTTFGVLTLSLSLNTGQEARTAKQSGQSMVLSVVVPSPRLQSLRQAVNLSHGDKLLGQRFCLSFPNMRSLGDLVISWGVCLNLKGHCCPFATPSLLPGQPH